jgi:hypothetical protein
MRSITDPVVVPPPTGMRVRTRLRVNEQDAVVLRAVGEHLGRLASIDLAARCRLGLAGELRADRKRALTSASSSRWAGAITRTSGDQWSCGWRNLLDARSGLRRAVRVIDRRLAVPVGSRQGRVRGYPSRQERWAKERRRQILAARLARVEHRIEQGRVSVVRGGRPLAKTRQHLQHAGLPQTEWQARWQAARWFICADGEADKPWGNETIRVHPDDGWLELKLPAPLGHLSNRPHGRWRLSCPVRFGHRSQEWAAQVTSGAVRYDITFDSIKKRWYLHASWTRPQTQSVTVQAATARGVVAVDLNVGHLACWVVDRHGNPVGSPNTIPLDLDGMPAPTRDGRMRAAISQILELTTITGCGAVAIENLDFADVRQVGRETMGRGRRGRQFRRMVAGIPIGQFRARLVQMAANRGLAVVAVDPGWTSVWGGRYWQEPLQHRYPRRRITRHHAASVVVGRRALGLVARRRPGTLAPDRRIGTASNCRLDQLAGSLRGGHGPPARNPPWQQHRAAQDQQWRPEPGSAQVAQDRSVPPVGD